MNPEETSIPKPSIRWFHPTPGRMLALLLAVEGILFLCDWFRWTPKGWAVLIVLAAVAATIGAILLWFIFAFLFGARFQYSIRSLLLLTVSVALPFSWFSVVMKHAKRQAEVIEKLKDIFECCYDFEKDQAGSCIAIPQPSTPAWLVDFLGVDFFADVVEVREATGIDGPILHSNITDETWELLVELPQTRKFIFFSGPLTDRRVETLTRVKCLEFLDLSHLDDEAINPLLHYTTLKKLEISSYKITDVGIARLSSLPNLEELHLHQTSDSAIRGLSDLSQLKVLDLRGWITGAAFEHIKELKQLRRLKIRFRLHAEGEIAHLNELKQLEKLTIEIEEGESMTFGGMMGSMSTPNDGFQKSQNINVELKYLGDLPNLRSLNIASVKLSNEGLGHLKRFTNLRSLRILSLVVTSEGIDALQKALPNTSIETPSGGMMDMGYSMGGLYFDFDDEP